MAEDQRQFEQLLTNLLSTETEIRTPAETTYESVPVGTKVPYLLTTIRNAAIAEEVRQMAAVLLRRLFSNEFEEFFPKLSPEVQAQLKEQLLASIQQEPSAVIRRRICDVTAELARNLIDDDGNNLWPEFLKFLFDCANSSSADLKECALQMFSTVPGVFGNQQAHYLDVIKQMLQQSLQAQGETRVRFTAVRATTSFILAHEKETSIHRHFADLLPAMIQGIVDSVEAQEDDILLKTLAEMAESVPRFLRYQIDPVMQLCMKIVENTKLEENWRHLALEVLVTLAETAPGMVRKTGTKYIPTLISQVLLMMVDMEDSPDWATADEIVEDDSDSNPVVGESALDRLACALGGKTILQCFITNIPPMLCNADWRYRHAALMAISAVGEGCHKQMEALLNQIMEWVLNFLRDPHPRVRYAACNAIGQMSTDFAPVFAKKFHDKVIPGLLLLMDDQETPRVQAHAGAALVNFSEDCPKNIFSQYLGNIINKLEAILQAKFRELVEKGTKLVLEQIVTTIASVADTSEEKFIDYYDRFMPCLTYIIQNANVPELRLLRGKTIECVSIIGLAVGREKFMADANEVMQLLLKTQTASSELAEDDPQISYMISAWARICKIMGKQFEQYLPLVMGSVLKTASLKPEVALLDSEDMEAVNGDDDWQFVSLGEQQNFGIRTAGLEDKATACQMLVCYARELKEGFAEYTEQVVKLMVPMLKFYFHDSVRMAAAESIPYLLDCAKIRGQDYVTDMWIYVCPELLKAIDAEPENEVLSEGLHALGKSIELLGAGCLNEQHMSELLRILDKILTEHFQRFADRQDTCLLWVDQCVQEPSKLDEDLLEELEMETEKRKDEDYDEIVEESLLDEDGEDVYILSKVSDVIHALFATHKEAFFTYFDTLLPHFVKLLAPDRPWSDHQWALCVFDDVIEHGGPACIKYQEYFLSHMLESVGDKNSEVRQAAAFGLGVMGQFAGEAFAQACAEALPRLAELINSPESRAPENVNATENAISAVTKIMKYNNSRINVNELLPHWLAWLPVWVDEDEAPHVYNYLCDLIEGNHPTILGTNNSNLPRILIIMSEAFEKAAVDQEAEVIRRMVNIIRQIQSNTEVFQACLAQVPQEQQAALHNVLNTH